MYYFRSYILLDIILHIGSGEIEISGYLLTYLIKKFIVGPTRRLQQTLLNKLMVAVAKMKK